MVLKKLWLSIATAAIVVAGLTPAGAATKTVEIPARRFEPERVSIFVGDTVRWINRDNRKHSVTANSSAIARGEDFDSSPSCSSSFLFGQCMNRGDTFSHTFTTAGTFTYRCKIHGSDTSFAACKMCGQVSVEERSPVPPPTGPPTSPSKTPTTPLSPTTSSSPTITPTGTVTSPGPDASGPSDGGGVPAIPVAAAVVLVLGVSGFFIYRKLLR